MTKLITVVHLKLKDFLLLESLENI